MLKSFSIAERNRQKVEQVERKLAAAKMNPKAGGFGKPASIPAPKPKDPQKALGQKSAIKLTLLKVSHYTLLMAPYCNSPMLRTDQFWPQCKARSDCSSLIRIFTNYASL